MDGGILSARTPPSSQAHKVRQSQHDLRLRWSSLVASNRYFSSYQLFCRFVESEIILVISHSSLTNLAVASSTAVLYDCGEREMACRENHWWLHGNPVLAFGQEVSWCHYRRSHLNENVVLDRTDLGEQSSIFSCTAGWSCLFWAEPTLVHHDCSVSRCA